MVITILEKPLNDQVRGQIRNCNILLEVLVDELSKLETLVRRARIRSNEVLK